MAKKTLSKVRSNFGKDFSKIGVWSFLVGLLIAVLAGGGLIPMDRSVWIGILGAMGLLVGLLNVTGKEAIPFLVATIALVVSVSGMSIVLASVSGLTVITDILTYVTIFVAPAALIVALKSIYVLASD